MLNDLNLYNKSQKNESDISNNLTIRTSFSKSNKNNYKYRNFHSMKESFLIKEKTKFNYSNISDIINDNHKYEKIFNFSKKKLKKKKSLKEEDKNSFKDVDFNYLSFSYPKKENDIKQKHYNNHRYQKHFRNERECPILKKPTPRCGFFCCHINSFYETRYCSGISSSSQIIQSYFFCAPILIPNPRTLSVERSREVMIKSVASSCLDPTT